MSPFYLLLVSRGPWASARPERGLQAQSGGRLSGPVRAAPGRPAVDTAAQSVQLDLSAVIDQSAHPVLRFVKRLMKLKIK